MKKSALILAAVLLFCGTPAHAIIDTFIGGAKYVKDEAYQAFMKIKVIEQVRILKENYDASMRYYKEFQNLNKGRGIFYNVGMQLKSAGEQMGYDLEAQVNRDFVNTYNTNTKVDQFYQSIDRGIANNMRYAGDELADMISKRKVGQDVAKNAEGLSPKDAANLGAKAQGLQLQMLAQIHEDNLRLIELNSMRLANDMRREKGEQKLITSIRKSVEKRAPGFRAEEER